MKEREKLFFTLSVIFKPYIAYCIMVDLGYNSKQLNYYINKWVSKGILDYGTSPYSGWFNFFDFEGEYKDIFDKIKYYAFDLPKSDIQNNKSRQRIFTDLNNADFYNEVIGPLKEFIINNYMEGFKND